MSRDRGILRRNKKFRKLIRKYKNEIARVKSRNPKIKRYTMFYRQWKKIGIPIEYR